MFRVETTRVENLGEKREVHSKNYRDTVVYQYEKHGRTIKVDYDLFRLTTTKFSDTDSVTV